MCDISQVTVFAQLFQVLKTKLKLMVSIYSTVGAQRVGAHHHVLSMCPDALHAWEYKITREKYERIFVPMRMYLCLEPLKYSYRLTNPLVDVINIKQFLDPCLYHALLSYI